MTRGREPAGAPTGGEVTGRLSASGIGDGGVPDGGLYDDGLPAARLFTDGTPDGGLCDDGLPAARLFTDGTPDGGLRRAPLSASPDGSQARSDSEAELRSFYADLHVHIGSTDHGEPVKISASRKLTFRAIAEEAADRKGVALVGVIDCHSPPVQDDIARCLDSGLMEEIAGGGIGYNGTVILPGCEIEVREPGGGPFHLLAYFPDLATMRRWTDWIRPAMKNVRLSSQRIRVTAREVQRETAALGGLLVPAHIFTPHRGLLGCSADRVADRLDPAAVAAVELGLSADTGMASRLSELDRYPFLTNSDAHSTGMIGRECNELLLRAPSFAELKLALAGADGRRIVANIGLHPRLGKYHTAYCPACQTAFEEDLPGDSVCPRCTRKLVRGVSDRIDQLADRPEARLSGRPPYRRQVPLRFFPGLGPRLLDRLLTEVGSEMEVLHRVPAERLASVAGEKLAGLIAAARREELRFVAGSGGAYGRIDTSRRDNASLSD